MCGHRWLLLPVFFVVSGLATDLRLTTPAMLPGMLLVLAAAISSKLLVALLAAPLARLPLRTAGVLCALLNCRGLLVLVINLKADELGLFGDGTKGALVIMAIVSTAMTGPLVRKLASPEKPTAPTAPSSELPAADEAPAAANGATAADGVDRAKEGRSVSPDASEVSYPADAAEAETAGLVTDRMPRPVAETRCGAEQQQQQQPASDAGLARLLDRLRVPPHVAECLRDTSLGALAAQLDRDGSEGLLKELRLRGVEDDVDRINIVEV